MSNGWSDIDPEGSNYYSCCGPIYTYAGHEDPGGFDQHCPIHGDEFAIAHGWCPECKGAVIRTELGDDVYDCPFLNVHRALDAARTSIRAGDS
jgi:hypothetical protein